MIERKETKYPIKDVCCFIEENIDKKDRKHLAEQLPKGVLESKKKKKIMVDTKQHTNSFLNGFECGVDSMKLYMSDYLKYLEEDTDQDYSDFIDSVKFIIDNSEEKMLEISTTFKKGNDDDGVL